MDFVHYQAPNRSKAAAKAASSDGKSPDTSSKTLEEVKANGSAKSDEQPEELETATRPRLTREQADLLERHFQQYYKPTGNMKRELATATGLSLQRIANWFQNRRAKSKQQKKQEEFELQQAMASANSNGMVMSGFSDYHHHMPEQFAPDMEFNFHHPQPVIEQQQQQQHFDQMRDFVHGAYTSPQNGLQAADQNFLSLQRSIDAANRAIAMGIQDHHHHSQNFSALDLSIPTSMAESQPFSVDGHPTSFPAPAYSDWSSRNSSAIWTPARQTADPFELQHHMQREPVIHEAVDLANDNGMEELCGVPTYDQFAHGIHAEQQKNPFMMQPFPSELVHRPQQHVQQQQPVQMIQPTQQMVMPMPIHPSRLGSQSSHESLMSPDGTQSPETDTSTEIAGQDTPRDEVFKLPEAPSLNIAARRKRPRPAAIGGAALRSQSFMGSIPMSPKSQLLGATSPMRRIKSTGNNLDLIRGRIQKNISVSGQKSPLNFETFADAGALDVIAPRAISRAQTDSVVVVPASAGLAPPTPLSPRFHMADSSHSSSNDSEQRPWGGFDPTLQSCFPPSLTDLQSDVASPPMTPMHPDLQASLQSFYMTHYSPAVSSAVSSGTPQWSLSSPEEPLTSPLFSNFQPSVHMPPPAIQSESDVSAAFQQLHYVPENKLPGHEAHASIALPSNEPAAVTAIPMATPEARVADTKVGVPEFFFHEPLPEQQPQPPQEMMQPRPRHYTFANQGPEDF